RAHLDLFSAGAIDNPTVTARVWYGARARRNRMPDTLHAELTLNDREVAVQRLHARQDDGRVTLSGTAQLQSMFPGGFFAPPTDVDSIAYALSLDAKNVSLRRTLADAFRPDGRLNVQLSAAGGGIRSQAIRGTVDLSASVEKFAMERRIGPINAQIAMRAGMRHHKLRVKKLSGTLGSALFSASGLYGLTANTLDLNVHVNAPKVNSLLSSFGIEDLHGAVTATARADGTLGRPSIKLELAADSGSAYGFAFDGLLCSATLDTTGFASAQRLSVIAGRSRIHASARARVLDNGSPVDAERMSLSARIVADTLHLEDIVDSLGGRLALQAEFEGTAAAPRGTLTVRADTLNISNQRIEGGFMRASLDKNGLDLDTLRAFFTDTRGLSARGRYSFDTNYDIALAADSVPMSVFNTLTGIEEFEGFVTVALDGAGTVDTPHIEGTLRVADFRMAGKPVGDIDLALSLRHTIARMTGTAGFDVDASYDLSTDDFSLLTVLDSYELSPWFATVDRHGMSGTVSGYGRMNGNVHKLEDIDAEVNLSRLELFRDETLVLANRLPIRATCADRRFGLSSADFAIFDGGVMRLDGNGDFDGSYTLSVVGSIPIRAASLLSPELSELEGRLDIDAQARGRGGSPMVEGSVRISEAGMIVPGSDQHLHDVNGDLRISENGVTVELIEGFLEDGSFALNGRMDLDGLKPGRYTASLKANAIPVAVPEVMDVLADARIEAEGTLDTSWIEGNVVLLRGLYYQDVNTNPFGEVGKVGRSIEPPLDTTSSPLDNVHLDVAFGGRNLFHVENNLATLSIAPDIRLRGTLSDPGITGRASVKEGTIYYRSREFEVTRGVIDFVNPYRIEPLVDLEASVLIDSIRIDLTASGTPDQLNLRLESESLDRDSDILSFLIFGKTGDRLQEKDFMTAVSPEQMVQELIRTTRIGDNLKERAGLDVLDVETGGEGGLLPVGVTVTVGKKFSPRLTTRVSLQSESDEVVLKATAEYRLFENALITGFQGSEGTFGGEVQLMLEFR
ncbi:MAG: hypothetical protein GF344_04205, partial [Chitinivibrionales bacterium]|nr:hypothetical protein [Chitinivibrionales bacterium]